MRSLTLFILVGALLFAMPVLAQDAASTSAGTNTEILIQKIKADKKLLVANNMDLTDAEAKKFWPLYDAYQIELGKLTSASARRSRSTPMPSTRARFRTIRPRSCSTKYWQSKRQKSK